MSNRRAQAYDLLCIVYIDGLDVNLTSYVLSDAKGRMVLLSVLPSHEQEAYVTSCYVVQIA